MTEEGPDHWIVLWHERGEEARKDEDSRKDVIYLIHGTDPCMRFSLHYSGSGGYKRDPSRWVVRFSPPSTYNGMAGWVRTPYPEATMTRDKSSLQIAKEILRRLVPPSIEASREIREKHDQLRSRAEEVQSVACMIRAAMGQLATDITGNGYNAGTPFVLERQVNYYRNGHPDKPSIYANFRIMSNETHRVELNVTTQQAVRIAHLLIDEDDPNWISPVRYAPCSDSDASVDSGTGPDPKPDEEEVEGWD